MTCRIELVYRVWDDENGGSVTIQEDGEPGLYDFDGVKFTVEQIPGIIEVLQKLETKYTMTIAETAHPFTPEEIARERDRMICSDPVVVADPITLFN